MIGPAALAPLVDSALGYLLNGENARAAVIVEEITEHGDGADVYGLCCAAADVAGAVFSAEDGRALLATVPADDPHRLFAGRFLTAYAAGDTPMTAALFRAAELAGEPERTESVCALLALTATLSRHAGAGPS